MFPSRPVPNCDDIGDMLLSRKEFRPVFSRMGAFRRPRDLSEDPRAQIAAHGQ
jgi:hypothetical protein